MKGRPWTERSTPAGRAATSDLVPVLDLGEQAYTGVFPRTREEARPRRPAAPGQVPRRRRPAACCSCSTRATRARCTATNYGYRSGLNASMVRAPAGQGAADPVARSTCPAGGIVLDIGSNDGTTLAAYPSGQVPDASASIRPRAKFRQYYPPDVQVVPDFFSAANFRKVFGDEPASVITSFSMFYDLEHPLDVHARGAQRAGRRRRLGVRAELPAADARAELVRHRLPRARRVLLAQPDPLDGPAHGLQDRRRRVQRRQRRQLLGDRGQGRQRAARVAAAGGRAGARAGRWAWTGWTCTPRSPSGWPAAASSCASSSQRAKAEGKTVGALGASTKGNVLLQYCGVDRRRRRGDRRGEPRQVRLVHPGHA